MMVQAGERPDLQGSLHVLASPESVGHLRFQDFLDDRLHQYPKTFRISRQQVFGDCKTGLNLNAGHGGVLRDLVASDTASLP
jgi:hypothetical protein